MISSLKGLRRDSEVLTIHPERETDAGVIPLHQLYINTPHIHNSQGFVGVKVKNDPRPLCASRLAALRL